ncbi:MAG TPA: energy transducer TonB [Candidatus Binatia bacterium]|nr:energy transducer TonB [Candidatus Binatia bacterium]
MQPAVPLPVGEGGRPGGGTLTPTPEKAPAFVPQAQVRPAAKPAAKPKPTAKRPPRPAVAASPEEKPQRVASLVLPPPSGPVAGEIGTGVGPGETTEDAGEGASGSGGKAGAGTGGGAGEGKGSGSSARPDYNVNPKPPYPMIARRLGAQGVVILRVQVREDGSVAAVELAHSSGFTVLDNSAVRTVRESWRFLPARIDGSPVTSWVEVPIRFVLEDS